MPGGTGPERSSADKALSLSLEDSRHGEFAGAWFRRPHKLEALGLAAVLIAAGLLRLPALTTFPPGMNQDEAANAWNAWCLLKTGHDQVGQSWPVFCFRALGEYRSALFLYVMMPFQALGGLNVWTMRLPAAIGGLATVLLAWWVGRRLFGPRVGLVTAALLAIDPTHIQMSRLGHEASITPLLTLAPLAVLIWAGFPLVSAGSRPLVGPNRARRPESADSDPRPPSLRRAAIAGLVIGICCYGYPATRLFIPPFLVACVLVTAGAWRRLARSRRGRLSILTLGLGLAVTFGPLAWEHLAHPETMNRRGDATWIWRAGDPAGVRVAKVLGRYSRHFGPDFLYVRGDTYEILWTAGTSFIPLALLPLQIAGLVLLVRRWRDSAAARILIPAILAYPIGDCLNWHASMHGLRSSPGLIPLLMLAALGLVWLAGNLTHARHQAAVVAIAGPLMLHFVTFAHRYMSVRPRDIPVYAGTHGDLLAAHDFLAPRLKRGDLLIISDQDMNQPYVVWLVADHYDPRRWFAEPREVQPYGDWDRYTRFGDTYFVRGRERAALIESLQNNGRTDHVYLAIRRDETAPGAQIGKIAGPDGAPALLVYEAWL
jgi:4-amino-4-deoxy-L-arabinose transferase-like glycosyltransferase